MWVPCDHNKARPHVADRAEGLQMWRVAANILNKQSRIADNGPPARYKMLQWAWNLAGSCEQVMKLRVT
jgi:hypothetical protein